MGTKKTIVIGLGGNALLAPGKSQSISIEIGNAVKVMRCVAKLVKSGRYNIVITHGNGPQVGDELVKNVHARKLVPALPLYVLNAETEASIGTVLETTLRSELKKLNVNKEVGVLLTHAVVDKKDTAFLKPTKPIGPFYSKAELMSELKLKKFSYIKVGAKYRRVVPSPRPASILEAKIIQTMIGNTVMIVAGGGGIPVVESNNGYTGVDSVIDKDMATQVLANAIGAEEMVILTDVDCVYRDFKSRKNCIGRIGARELKPLIKDFEVGTMRPKLEACIRFIENGGNVARIGDISKFLEVIEGKSGTTITA